ncbi:MAG: hypothetical protein EAZ81_03890 [Verrucomicrobia bacterium]|nr:MAG: hypothetical protein EAZ81_03890 [Verrucomicrobiota bacterium]
MAVFADRPHGDQARESHALSGRPSEIGVVNLGMIAMTKFGKIRKFCQNQPRWPLAFLSREIRFLA